MLANKIPRPLIKRLLPLYIAGFFHSFVLWYTIEKLFMQSIGFDNTMIGFMVALYSAVMLLVEVPSGILADRWSRKGVLIIASVCLSLSALLGGLSHDIGLYLFSAVLWGCFFACYSGLYDTIIYDCIAETTPQNTKLFDRLYGRLQLFDSVGLILASLAGAAIAAAFDLRLVYFLAAPIALIPIVALLGFKEPTLHKKHVVLPLKKQVSATVQAIVKNHALLPVIVVLIVRSTIFYCVVEFAQLWLLALQTPTAYFGVANAFLLASLGIGGILVGRLDLSHTNRMLVALVVLILASIGLIYFRDMPLIVLAQAIFTTGLICVYIVFSRILHDNVDSSVRAGAASVASTAGRLLIIPMALLIGWASQQFTIFNAAFILMTLAIIMSGFVLIVARRNNNNGLQPTNL